MKYITSLIVVAALVIVVLMLMGDQNDPPVTPDTTQLNEWRLINVVLWKNNRFEDLVGVKLPEVAVDVRFYAFLNFSTGIKSNWFVARLPKDEFDNFIDRTSLKQAPNLLEVWPEALECEAEELSDVWNPTETVNEDTYLYEDPNIVSRTMIKYEGGCLYLKRSIHLEMKLSPDREILYKAQVRQ